jgi:hypothetical protein
VQDILAARIAALLIKAKKVPLGEPSKFFSTKSRRK